MQKITIAGNLGKDPEERFTSSGLKVISFSVAVNRKRSGNEETNWYRVTIFGDRFDKMVKYLKKGSSVIVVGDFNTNKWTDANGVQQTTLEVTADSISFSPFGRPEQTAGAPPQQQQAQNFQPADVGAPTMGQGSPDLTSEDDEPLPF